MQPIYIFRNTDEATEPKEVRIDRFPEFAPALRTIAIHTHNFHGKVTVEASIELTPEMEADWVPIWVEDFDIRYSNVPAVRNRLKSLAGHFIWMRVKVETITGHVDRVLVL